MLLHRSVNLTFEILLISALTLLFQASALQDKTQQQQQHVLIRFESDEAKEQFWEIWSSQHEHEHEHEHEHQEQEQEGVQQGHRRIPDMTHHTSHHHDQPRRRLYKYKHAPILAASMTSDELQKLQTQVESSSSSVEETIVDHGIVSIEKEEFVYHLHSNHQLRRQPSHQRHLDEEMESPEMPDLQNQEIVPYGIQTVQGNTPRIPPSGMTNNFISNCQNPEAFKVCVIDEGLQVSHEDIPYTYTNSGDNPSNNTQNIKGQSFVGLDWWNPSSISNHGTLVTGILFAEANNGYGIHGMMPSANEGVCLLFAEVFDESGRQLASVITEAVEWCADEGANVINMSLGSIAPLEPWVEDAYRRIVNDQGVLIVASAGNGGNSFFSYPASLPEVISVAATNQDGSRAIFSQYNSQVDIAAPGVDILSTTTSDIEVLAYLPNSNGISIAIQVFPMSDSPSPSQEVLEDQWELVDCGFGLDVCDEERTTNKFCIVERGINVFWEKAFNCQQAGGVGLIIYNSRSGIFGGVLSPPFGVNINIPVFSTTQRDGRFLLSRIRMEDRFMEDTEESSLIKTTIELRQSNSSYTYVDGTSFSAPHVSGAAAKIWAARPNCTNHQIRQALEQSAIFLPFGSIENEDRNDAFGYGMVQAENAYLYIMREFDFPCGGRLPNSSVNKGEISGERTDENQDDTNEADECAENFSPCEENSDCCSGRCELMFAGMMSLFCFASTDDGNGALFRQSQFTGADMTWMRADDDTLHTYDDIHAPFQHIPHDESRYPVSATFMDDFENHAAM